MQNMIRKILLKIICILIYNMCNAQDFDSEFKSLFMNLPIKDSIEDIIKGNYGYTFQVKEEEVPSEAIKNIFIYTAPFSNPNLFKDCHGLIYIQKNILSNSSVNYAVVLKFTFDTKETQFAAYEYILKKFEKCTNKTHSSEQIGSSSESFLYSSILEHKNEKLRIENQCLFKKRELSVTYMMRKK